ncbi:glycoside hydrolase family 31 protein [Arenibacter sp. F26102]|uniref:glycoside hydrolase family 31 protein n=1 Tax=Arenibacter sp. F26102 TaxID=2926416 RepID=UPI001FF19083|nr:glycoside hydrolase family 31 protein [Arenibacter sp. F26102]MCK0147221.1 glycoside hydrolase family 31 protein [Arenibacter sp. F26102]
MKKLLLISLLLITTYKTYSQNKEKVEIAILQDEYWWGGLSAIGHNTPYDSETIESHDLWGDNKGNQAQPLLLSSKGRYVWSESPIKYVFDKGKITVTTRSGEIQSGSAGENLRDAYNFAVSNFFPPNGKTPEKLLFTKPQYNTWIELIYNQNEDDILKYAQAIIDKGYPPGVLMIDDNWQESYGTWEFSPRRFKDPKGMIKKLHGMGFKVMLWVCPFVSADTEIFRHLAKEGMLLLDADRTQEVLWANTENKAAIIRWWNGASACLDLSNPRTQDWFEQRLKFLMDEYGVDGFKFDAGDADFYTDDIISFVPEINPNDHTTYFAKLGLQFPLNEYRASWKMAGLPLAQRLRDKNHSWNDLEKLIPDLMSQSLMGYAYTCPDMIGGGEHQSFENSTTIDQELVVRSAQVHALMPMMQFSVAPWRVLSEENNQLCLEASLLHAKMGSLIQELAEEASRTGEPIVKPMALAYPNSGYETIKDQFMLGDHILVTPVIKKGERKRKVVLPKGKWKAENGETFRGGRTIEIDVPLSRLPYFTKK